ncbi:MAG: hypothetical protein AAGA19_02385 [Pseudomonadota bacterium]
MRAVASAMLIPAFMLAMPVPAQTVPQTLARHAECVARADSSTTCVEILNTYCLETAGHARDLARCRVAVTDALEHRANALIERLEVLGARPMAIALSDGAERAVSGFCAALAGRMPSDGPPQDIRCALMRAHVLVYHLSRALSDLDHKT